MRFQITANPKDRELAFVANALERLAARVESEFDRAASEGDGGAAPDGRALLAYATECLKVLDDPATADRLIASR